MKFAPAIRITVQIIDGEPHATCNRCAQTKPLNRFKKDVKATNVIGYNGYRNYCMECARKALGTGTKTSIKHYKTVEPKPEPKPVLQPSLPPLKSSKGVEDAAMRKAKLLAMMKLADEHPVEYSRYVKAFSGRVLADMYWSPAVSNQRYLDDTR